MAFVDHVRRCNAYTPEAFVPWSIDGQTAGFVHRIFRKELAGYAGLFVDDGGLALDPRHADAESRTTALAETVELLRPALCDADGNWTADYVRLRVAAVKP